MRRGLYSVMRDESGATAVEFALVIVPLLLLLLGTFETGRLLWTHHALQEAAISGARCVGLRAPTCAVDGTFNDGMTRSFIQEMAATRAVDVSESTIELEQETICAGEPGFSQVRIVHAYSSVLPALTGSQVEVEACFPNQPQPSGA